MSSRRAAAPAEPQAPETDLELLVRAREQEFATTIPVGQPPVKLEARLANQRSGSVAVVFCPALPPAGTMYIPEIAYLQAKLAQEGFVTVRFNFRGVGGSERGGSSSFFRSAAREMEDVRDVARWLAAHRAHFKLPRLERCFVVGVSYGSVIAAAAAHFQEFDGYVAVAYPVNYLWYCTSFDSAKFFELAKSAKPKLFVWGNTDVFAGKLAMDQCFDALPEPKRKCGLDELDSFLGHYFRSKANLDALFHAVHRFLRDESPKTTAEEQQRRGGTTTSSTAAAAAAAAAGKSKKATGVVAADQEEKAEPKAATTKTTTTAAKTRKKKKLLGFF